MSPILKRKKRGEQQMKKWIVLVAMIMVAIWMVTCFAESQTDSETIAVGDTVAFGSYEQDNNTSNGRGNKCSLFRRVQNK